MLQSVYATKMGMTQAWTKAGKRLPVTKVKAASMAVVGVRNIVNTATTDGSTRKQIQLGLGTRKLERMHKPLRANLQAQGFSHGIKAMKSVYLTDEAIEVKAGDTLALQDMLSVGDVVLVQGITKGKGFAGVVKRHGFKGGPRTHGQSDRLRAPGSIGPGTTPGRTFKNQRMAGHMGVEAVTVQNLIVVHIDTDSGEIWLSGPVPGAISSQVRITKTGENKEVELNRAASHLPEEKVAEPVAEEVVEETVEESPVAETTEEAPVQESTSEESSESAAAEPAESAEAPVEEKTEA